MSLLLVVEDDGRMRKYLRSTLTDQRFRVVDAATGSEALVQAAAHNPDLVVLDFALPDFDAVQVTTRLREWTGAPILILSAHDSEHEKVAALDAGANDFLTKPFATGETGAHSGVATQHPTGDADSLDSILAVGELKNRFSRRLAFADGREVRFTPTQYKLFGVMMRNAGKVLTHEQILFMVRGPAYTKETQYLRVYMGKLRQKFEKSLPVPGTSSPSPASGIAFWVND